MNDCIFCKIIRGEIPSKKVFENDGYFAFRDINPSAPVHVLIVPKVHVEKLTDFKAGDEALIGGMFTVANRVAELEKVAVSGYRTVINCGKSAGQLVNHVHMHFLGGREMGWPPG
jgi:histidine triad (HIT) family protein